MVAAISGITASQAAQSISGIGGPASSGFSAWIGQELQQVNAQLVNADQGLQELAMGNVDNLHQVMIGIEKARVSLQFLVQVRSRVLEAYQDVLRMQV